MDDTVRTIEQTYRNRTRSSAAHDIQAKRSMPGGDTRWVAYYQPCPVYMFSAQGCRMSDVDGNSYLDFQNNYTALVHGHRPAEVMEAVSRELSRDIITGAPSESQYVLADQLVSRVPGIDFLRFSNSGTEATMMAMRAARVHTGRQLILKMEGGYHGSHDFAQISINPSLAPGPLEARAENPGIPSLVLPGVKVARFNDIESVEQIMEEFGEQIAAVIIEPVMNTAGIIPAEREFLQGLREITSRYGSLLIFDEIVTYRLAPGGLQQEMGVIPDITVLGKLIGGGFSIGAFGGASDIMENFNPARERPLQHSGTFNGHPAAMAAGAAAVSLLTEEAITHINTLGEKLEAGIASAFRDAGLHGHASRAGSLLYVQWCSEPVREAGDVLKWKQQAEELPRLLHLSMLNRGIFMAKRGLMNISTAMKEKDIASCLDAFRDSLHELYPYAAAHAPHLLRD